MGGRWAGISPLSQHFRASRFKGQYRVGREGGDRRPGFCLHCTPREITDGLIAEPSTSRKGWATRYMGGMGFHHS